jgi:GMP synthase-like glutamine amidotransferase
MKPIGIVQNCRIESPGLIEQYLTARDVPFQVVKTFDRQALPRPRNLRAAIVLGTPVSVREYLQHDYLRRLYEFMSEAVRFNLPLMGICFGGQMLAHVLGARVEPNPQCEIGIYKVKLTDEGAADPLFKGFEREFEVFQWHGDTFQVPRGSTLLAEGETCRNQAFRKGRAVAMQFHVEPRADEIPMWCDEYADELKREKAGKTKIVAEFKKRSDTLTGSTERLLENFLG